MSELSDKLAILPITIESVHVTFDYSDPTWLHDAWHCTISYEGRSATFGYRTGIGHRKADPALKREGSRYWHKIHGAFYTEGEAVRTGLLKLKSPELADVLGGYLSDASACEETFEDWCSNLGYDSDSRKALATYLACQEAGVRLRKVLGGALFAELRTLEH